MQPLSSASIPSNVHRIHFTAICGTAMGALACMLKEMGYDVVGSDQHVYPPMSEFLMNKGIHIFEGFKSEHLSIKPDLVVVGNAVSKDNPEVLAMQKMGLPYCSMPVAINHFAAAGKQQIVVTGTHGKTTTSSFIAWMLHCAGLDPSFLIGGIIPDFKSNYRVGQGNWVVLEGDEYDTAFFDKGAKFLHYTPKVALLTSVEFDHADIFNDLDHVKNTFRRFAHGLSQDSILVAYDQDANIDSILPGASCCIARYGNRAESQWHLGQIRIEPPYTFFDVYHGAELYAQFKTRMIGRHNLTNLLSAVAVGYQLKIDRNHISIALENFKGVRRRQEVRGVKNDIVVIDDFAHHPTAVKATIEAIKSFYGQRRVVAVFEPRTNSSRRSVFQTIYPGCFDAADEICIRQAPLLEKIPENQRFSSDKLVQDLKARGKSAHFFDDTDGIITFLCDHAKPGDILLIMSNGGFDNIHKRLLDLL